MEHRLLLNAMVPVSKRPEMSVVYSQHISHALRFQRTDCIGATSSSLAPSRYCLADRPKCRFTFPSPMESQQQCGNDTGNLALRMHNSEDPWLFDQAPKKAGFIAGQVNSDSPDSKVNSDNIKCYINKYGSKTISCNATISVQGGG